MMARIMKKQSEITREEWVLYNWVGVQELLDGEPLFIRGFQRDIAKAIQAGEQWDEWHAAYEALHKVENA